MLEIIFLNNDALFVPFHYNEVNGEIVNRSNQLIKKNSRLVDTLTNYLIKPTIFIRLMLR